MHHRALTRRRGNIDYCLIRTYLIKTCLIKDRLIHKPLLTLTTVLTLLNPLSANALPGASVCDFQAACGDVMVQETGADDAQSSQPVVNLTDSPMESEPALPAIFGELPFPDLAMAIAQAGVATRQIGSAPVLDRPLPVTVDFNELFDYAGQSLPDERIARLEPELPTVDPMETEYAWVRAIPVPEPATLALLGLGLLGMFLLKRGRSKD